MTFSEIFREERWYCNHFFRLLCHDPDRSAQDSGLGRVLATLGDTAQYSVEDLEGSEVLTEVAVLRDVYFTLNQDDRRSWLESVFDTFVAILDEERGQPVGGLSRPSLLWERLGEGVHPSKLGNRVRGDGFSSQEVQYYGELGALFNAKPDFLVLLPGRALWIEAKVDSKFSSRQVQRMLRLARLCASPSLRDYFAERQPEVILLGSWLRHRKARRFPGCQFLSWHNCAEIASAILPRGAEDRSVKAFLQAERGHSVPRAPSEIRPLTRPSYL